MARPFVANQTLGGVELETAFTDLEARVTHAELFAQNTATTTGLTFGYKAGRVKNGATVTAVAAGTIVLAGSSTNYVEVDSAGTVSLGSGAFTSTKKPVGVAITDGASITSFADKRVGFDFSGSGDTVGAASSTDNALARFDSTTGKIIQNSTATLDDTGAFTLPEMAAPSTPASGKVAFYAKADGRLYLKDDGGTEVALGVAGVGTGDMTKATYDSDLDGVIGVANGGTGASTATNARSNLGLGSMATQAASGVAITGGTVTGITDLAIADGGTGASTAAAAFSALKQAATTSATGVVELATDGENAANVVVQGNDSRLSDTRIPTDNTVSTAKVQDDAITYAKMQNVSATDKLLGRSTAGAGNVEEITCTSFARSILDDTTAADVRTTIGVSASSGTPQDMGTGATFTPNVDNGFVHYGVTNANATLANPTGTLTEGSYTFELKKGNASHTLTLGTKYLLNTGVLVSVFDGAGTNAYVRLYCFYNPRADSGSGKIEIVHIGY